MNTSASKKKKENVHILPPKPLANSFYGKTICQNDCKFTLSIDFHQCQISKKDTHQNNKKLHQPSNNMEYTLTHERERKSKRERERKR